MACYEGQSRRTAARALFELEPLRQRNEAWLLEALRSQALPSLSFDGWSRILDYRDGLQPLSVAGSLKGEGGRFNIGADLSPGAFTLFPALYMAEDYDAAFRERFAAPSTAKSEGLSVQELALRAPGSFTQVRLRGMVETVIDVGNLEALKLLAGVLREFPIPKDARRLARTLGLHPPPWLVRSPTTLQRQLLHPNWRMLPQQFDLPSNSQIFGRIALAAGISGILYRQTPRAQLLEFLDSSPDFEALSKLPDDELLLVYCERMTGRVMARTASPVAA